jgi:hypothetical protein
MPGLIGVGVKGLRDGHLRAHQVLDRLAVGDHLVEETLRREVVGFLCAHQIDPDIGAAIFVLAPAEEDAAGVPREADAKAEDADRAVPH